MAICIAIVGAESTGKTTLAAALAPRLARETGLRVACVPELLRAWCDRAGRMPQAHEQGPILRARQEQILQAAATHDVVVCDTTALATAVYSRMVFGDRSLEARAVALQRQMIISLLTALDLPGVADGPQREGAQVRELVDTLLRELLMSHRLPWALVAGVGAARLEAAVDAVAPLLRTLPETGTGTGTGAGARTGAGAGLFTRLAAHDASAAGGTWACNCCDDPVSERRSRACSA